MRQSKKKFKAEIRRETALNYLEYLPKGFDPKSAKKYPLLIFLHGMGERGDDLSLLKRHGIPKLIDEQAPFTREYEFIAISPQCPDGLWWPWVCEELAMLLRQYLGAMPVDTGRIYMTGLSMGGYGTWEFARRYPNALAAIAPICGGTSANALIGGIGHLPVWAFHGEKDPVVSLSETAGAVARLNDLGAKVKYTVYPGVEHDSWTATYENPELYRWLFSQRNGAFELGT